jgi:peptidoglycan/LPS O-acetylase OafA/YrhL
MGLRLSEGAMSMTLYVVVVFLTRVPSMLRVSRLQGCNGHVLAKVGRRVRASGVVLAWCWSRIIAARISSIVKIPFAWREDDCSWAFRAGFGRVRSEARRVLQGGGLGMCASGVVVGVGIVSARRSGPSGVSKNVGQRVRVRSASTE